MLWIPLAILLWLGNIALHLDASRIRREMLWSQDEVAISKKSQEQADSVLNHVLKNIMVDVSNCIEMHKEGSAPDDMLEEAEALLFRGKWWCRMREAILNIAAGRSHCAPDPCPAPQHMTLPAPTPYRCLHPPAAVPPPPGPSFYRPLRPQTPPSQSSCSRMMALDIDSVRGKRPRNGNDDNF